jgi:hypothetical protein
VRDTHTCGTEKRAPTLAIPFVLALAALMIVGMRRLPSFCFQENLAGEMNVCIGCLLSVPRDSCYSLRAMNTYLWCISVPIEYIYPQTTKRFPATRSRASKRSRRAIVFRQHPTCRNIDMHKRGFLKLNGRRAFTLERERARTKLGAVIRSY